MRSVAIVPGTPRWAVVAACLTPITVLPAALWRSALGFGAELGMPSAWRSYQELPGAGTPYVLGLSIGSLFAACLTLGLVQRWGEVVPSWVPRVGGRRVPVLPVVATSMCGAALVCLVSALSIANWNMIIGHKGMPEPGGYALATAAYAPTTLWAPLLLAVTWAYYRRRARPPRWRPMRRFTA